jgi:hypothetical protein
MKKLLAMAGLVLAVTTTAAKAETPAETLCGAFNAKFGSRACIPNGTEAIVISLPNPDMSGDEMQHLCRHGLDVMRNAGVSRFTFEILIPREIHTCSYGY